jgi:hypothetical protein
MSSRSQHKTLTKINLGRNLEYKLLVNLFLDNRFNLRAKISVHQRLVAEETYIVICLNYLFKTIKIYLGLLEIIFRGIIAVKIRV